LRRIVARIAPGHLDVAAAQHARDAVVALLAVDVGVVVVVGVRRRDVPGAEELVEHLLPGVHVHVGGRREHAVEVEEHGVESVESGRSWCVVGHGGSDSWGGANGRGAAERLPGDLTPVNGRDAEAQEAGASYQYTRD